MWRSPLPVGPRGRIAILLASATVVTASGCGADDPPPRELVLAYPTAPDSLDPAMSATGQGWNALWRVYTPPLTYASDGTGLVPGVAASVPEPSEDGRTYTLTVRRDARFSDGRAVRPTDIEHTLVRVLAMGSPGAPLFLGIEGAPAVLEKRTRDISGVEADDANGTVTFHLERADTTFPYALATSYAGVVPADVALSDRSGAPPPGAGPYRLRVTKMSRGFELVPVRDDGPQHPIDVRYLTRPEAQVGDVRDGKVDVVDQATPGDALNELRRDHADRYRAAVGLHTSLFFLNVRTPPFDDRRVRQAAALAVDPGAVARLYGGLLRPDCALLPPTISPPEAACTQTEPDLSRARRLVTEAGATGARVKVWAPAEGPDRAAATYLADALEQIGLDARPTTIAFATYYGTISKPAAHVQAGVLSWALDFPHPSGMLRIVDADELNTQSTNNFSNVRDEQITRGIDDLAARPVTVNVNAAYAALADRAVREGYVIPYGHGERAVLLSERMDADCVRVHPIYGPDLARLCTR